MALKAPSVPAAAAGMRPLLGAETMVVTAQNGVPWWYFYKHGGELENTRLQSVDPGGHVWQTIGPQRVVGCVVYPAAEVIAPGRVRHVYGKRFMLGEPDGSKSERVRWLSRTLRTAGLKAPVRTNIRDDIWLKLWGNLSFNPLSVLTQASLARLGTDPEIVPILRQMMQEGEAIAVSLGIEFTVDLDTRIRWAAEVGEHKTSMLQDLERRRTMEIDALVTSVQEMGRLTGVATPTIDTILALVKLRAREAGCYP